MKLIIWIYIVSICFILTALGYGTIGTVAFIPIMFFYNSLKNSSDLKVIANSNLLKIYIVFLIVGFLSVFVSFNPQVAFNTLAKTIIVFIFGVSLYSFSINSLSNTIAVLQGFSLLLILVLIYVQIFDINLSERRLEEGVLNANTYGYIVYVGLTSLFLLYSINKRKLNLLLLIIIIPFSIDVILKSASRGASAILVLLIVSNVFIISFFQKELKVKKILKGIVVLSVLFFLIFYAYINFYQGSFLEERFMMLEGDESTREYHLKKAFEIFLDNPVMGVGGGNYAVVPKEIEMGSFTHNTYAEILANYGFFGGSLYFIFQFYILRKITTKITRIPYGKILVIRLQVLIFFLLYQIYSFLYVVYLNTVFMGFLFALIPIINQLKNDSLIFSNEGTNNSK